MNDLIKNVVAVCINSSHSFSKTIQKEIKLIKMIGVEGDAHAGKYVKHLSRAKKHPKDINLRQVHLIEKELLEELLQDGFEIRPGNLGENITTSGIELIIRSLISFIVKAIKNYYTICCWLYKDLLC